MKRLLALLLTAALLLGAAQAAGGYRTTIKWQTTPENMQHYLAAYTENRTLYLSEVPAQVMKDQADLANALSAVMNATEITCRTNEDRSAAEMAVTMRGIELVNTAMNLRGDHMTLSTSLLPGVVIDDTVDLFFPNPDWYARVNHKAVSQQLADALDSWLASMTPVTEHGIFEGDAYTGGDTCITYAFDDAKVAQLVEALYVPYAPYIRSDALQDLLDNENQRVARENTYAYRLHEVKRGDETIGCSLNCYQGDELVTTVSVNTAAPYQVVIGYAANDAWTTYEALTLDIRQSSASRLSFTADWDAYAANGSEAYAAVKGTRPMESLHVDAELTLGSYSTMGTVKTNWEGGSFAEDNDRGVFVSVDADFVLTGSSLDLTATTYAGTEECWTTVVKTEQIDPIPAISMEGMQVLSMDKIATILTYERLEQMSQDLTVKLFKAVPPEMLVYLIQFGRF